MSLLLIGIVGVSHIDAELFAHHHHEHEDGVSEQTHEQHHEPEASSVRTIAIIVLSLGTIGWVIEEAITGAIIRFISRVRPDNHIKVTYPSTPERSKTDILTTSVPYHPLR